MVRCVAPVLPFACLKAMPVHKAVRPIGYVAALSCLALLSVVVADNGRAAAVPPVLDIPVACEPGRDCFIQFYVDRDESVGIADYRCAGLTYDGHKGTDFRLADLPAMRRGVEVRAAAEDAIAQAGAGGGFVLSGTDAGVYDPHWFESFMVMADVARNSSY